MQSGVPGSGLASGISRTSLAYSIDLGLEPPDPAFATVKLKSASEVIGYYVDLKGGDRVLGS